MHTYTERAPDSPLGRAGDPVPRNAYDASLLFQRMKFYQIDRNILQTLTRCFSESCRLYAYYAAAKNSASLTT